MPLATEPSSPPPQPNIYLFIYLFWPLYIFFKIPLSEKFLSYYVGPGDQIPVLRGRRLHSICIDHLPAPSFHFKVFRYCTG